HGKHLSLFRRVVPHVGWQLRPGTNQAHLSFEYIPKLGKFIQLPLAQMLSNWRHPAVPGGRYVWSHAISAWNHRPKLQNSKRLPGFANPFLGKEYRFRGTESDCNGDQNK